MELWTVHALLFLGVSTGCWWILTQNDTDGSDIEVDLISQNQRIETAISRHVADLVARILEDTRCQAAAEEEFGELVLRYRFVQVR